MIGCNDPLVSWDKKFFNGKIDLYEKSLKERIMEIIEDHVQGNEMGIDGHEEASVNILKLFHDYIQTQREEYKYVILNKRNEQRVINRHKNRDLACIGLQMNLRDLKHGGSEF